MRNLKNIILSFSAFAIASTLSTVAIAKEWRGWNIHKPGYPNTVAMDKFAELVKQKNWRRNYIKNVSLWCFRQST